MNIFKYIIKGTINFIMEPSFNVRAVFMWKSDRLYRVCIDNQKLYFIRVGGQGVGAYGLSGAIGALIAMVLQKRNDKQTAKLDMTNPEEAIRNHKDSFFLTTSQINQTSIEPMDKSSMHGVNFGQWLLTETNDTKWRFQFESKEDMKSAIDMLSAFFGNKLVCNVEWDVKKNRFIPRHK
ncbi:MAG: hypothetical protein ACYC0V_08365 [Armatimonadota bacterium]